MSLLTPAEARIVALKKQIRRHKKTISLVKIYGLSVLQKDKKKPKTKKKALVAVRGGETPAPAAAQHNPLRQYLDGPQYNIPMPNRRWGPAGAAEAPPAAIVERR